MRDRLPIVLKHFVEETSTQESSDFGTAHVPQPYKRVVWTITLYNIDLLPLCMKGSSQTCSLLRILKAKAAKVLLTDHQCSKNLGN